LAKKKKNDTSQQIPKSGSFSFALDSQTSAKKKGKQQKIPDSVPEPGLQDLRNVFRIVKKRDVSGSDAHAPRRETSCFGATHDRVLVESTKGQRAGVCMCEGVGG